jgi:hypothetical protein
MHFRRERLVAEKQHLVFDQRVVPCLDNFIDLCVAPAQRRIEVETMHLRTERWRPSLHHEITHFPRVLTLSTKR